MRYWKIIGIVIAGLFVSCSVYGKEWQWHLGPKVSLTPDESGIECNPVWSDGLPVNPNYLPRQPIVEWGPINVPGKYKVTMRIKAEHVGISSHIWLEAWEKGGWVVDTGYGPWREPIAYDRLYGQRFIADNKYTEFDLTFRVSEKPVYVALTYRAGSENDLGIMIVEKSSLKLEQIPSPVIIVRVRPDKIRYRRNESGLLNVTLKNTDNKQQNVNLSADLMGEINDRYPISSTEVLLEPEELKTIEIPFKASKEDGGYEANVKISVDSKVIDENNEYFCVSDNPFKFGIVTSSVGGDEPEYQIPLFLSGSPASFDDFNKLITEKWEEYSKNIDLVVKVMRKNYNTYYEFFAWAPDDLLDLTPDGEDDKPFFSGQTFYISSKKQLRTIIEKLHKEGISVSAYANAASLGWGIDWFRRRPEWLAYKSNGQPDAQFRMEIYEKYKTGIKDTSDCYPSFSINFEAISPIDGRRVLDYHIDEIIESQKMFGWDAIRYDAADWHKYTPELRKELNKRSNPKIHIGHNVGIYLLGDQPSEKWDLYCADGSLMFEESTTFANKESDPRHLYKDWSKFVVRGSDLTRNSGGHYYYIYSGFSHWATLAIGYVSRAHPWSRGISGFQLLGNYNQFMVRYGIFFWDERVKGISNPEENISVNSNTPLWWKQFASERILGEKHKQIIIPLINQPKNKEVTNPTPSPRQENVEVILNIPKESSIVNAYLLSPEPYTRCVPLEIKKERGKIIVKVPTFYFWCNVLFDIKG